ncbi:hypothetical protein PHLGIDRAFT_17340 [Phlebiopsis gigantea 11061_1 CR5-6]|uniref:Uncharacterized protein n=1 Tax=Phlebiopsis gigantea (strain 11061_1 CR5-6) TaxID=745531 RepID=A0A0C3RYG9_PHLG1|nr:hypothetical protein PHLGIDRAFT_17340 [Phlebiopsis gigantea 11061_1 CR5-6]
MVARLPNRAKGGRTYATLSVQEREQVPFVWLEQATLTFDSVNIVPGSTNRWDKIISYILPDKGWFPSSRRQGFDQSTYLRAWIAMLNRLDNRAADIVVNAARQRLATVTWLPEAGPAALWTSRTLTERGQHLPVGMAGPGPLIVACPRLSTLQGLKHFKLRDTTTEEE